MAGVINRLPLLPGEMRLSAEFQLLIASTWIAPPTHTEAQVNRIVESGSKGINWETFLALLDRHRVVVVNHDGLRGFFGERLPARIHEELRMRKKNACQHGLRNLAEISRINKAFATRTIEVVPLKGVLLSQRLYGDPGARLSCDIDLLVKPVRLEDADELLRTEGYIRNEAFELTKKRKQWLIDHTQHFDYYHSRFHLKVELHWRFNSWSSTRVNDFWNQCQTAKTIGGPLLSPNDEALLLFLCDHGARHGWRRAKWLSDVAILFARLQNSSCDYLLELSKRFDLTRPLAQATLLVCWLYEIQMPDALLGLVASESHSMELACDAMVQMQLSETDHTALANRWRSFRYQGSLYSSRTRFSVLRDALISLDYFKEYPLPDRLFWLYGPLRPWLWIHHHYINKSHAKLDKNEVQPQGYTCV